MGWTAVMQTPINLGIYKQVMISATSTKTVPVNSVRNSDEVGLATGDMAVNLSSSHQFKNTVVAN